MDVPEDLTMNTADVKADAPEEPVKAPQEAVEAEKAPEPTPEPEKPAEAPQEAVEKENGGLLDTLREALALKDEVKELKAQLEAVTKRAEEAEAYRTETRKAEALREAGLPEQCARFLGDSESDWAGAIEDLKALRQSQAPAPKGIPADGKPGDQEPRTEDGTATLSDARNMLGV